MRYAVLFEKTETGYSAHVPDLPGCVAAGSTLEETVDLIRGAIRMHVNGMLEDGESVPNRRQSPSTSLRLSDIRRGRLTSSAHFGTLDFTGDMSTQFSSAVEADGD